MKKTIVAMLVSGTILFPGLSQAQTLEQSVAQSLATHPKIKEAFDLYQARLYQHDGAKGRLLSHHRSAWWRRLREDRQPATRRGTGELTGDGSIDDSMTRKEAGISLRQMLFDGFDVSSNVARPMPLPRPSVRPDLRGGKHGVACGRGIPQHAASAGDPGAFQAEPGNPRADPQRHPEADRFRSGIDGGSDQIDGRVARAYSNQAAAENNYRDAESEFIRVVNEVPKDLVQPVPNAQLLPATLEDALKTATEVHPTLLSSPAGHRGGQVSA